MSFKITGKRKLGGAQPIIKLGSISSVLSTIQFILESNIENKIDEDYIVIESVKIEYLKGQKNAK